ncbi:hypothetical protein [Streptomyces prunicolor]
MPDTPTTRLGMYKSLPDGSEDVSYTTDIGQNLDKLDAAVGFQIVTSSTRPSSPYSGKPIAESDTGRLYYSNGTLPASASWVEIASNGASFTLTSTKSITLNGTSGSTAKLTALVGGDPFNRLEVTADGTMNWGPGSGATDVGLARTATNTLGTLSGDHWKVGGDLKLVNGATTLRNQLASTVTVANTTSETVIGTLTIPANDAVVGAVYRVVVYGTASVTATPTFTIRGRLGGVAGALAATIGAVTASSGVTNQTWSAEFDIVCLTTGGSGTWMPRLVVVQNVSVASTQTGTVLLPTAGASLTRDTTASSDMVLTWAWSAASASNTVTARAFAYRLA